MLLSNQEPGPRFLRSHPIFATEPVKVYFKGVLRENGAKMLELIVSEWKINSGLTAEQLSRKP